MITHKLYDEAGIQWYMFGRDPEKPEKIIDTNQYLMVSDGNALLMDPGGLELFPAMLASVVNIVELESVRNVFASHQDPDIISSLGLWDSCLPDATLHAPWLWEGFLRHFGMQHMQYNGLPDDGETIKLGTSEVQFVPAHYLHSSGNFHVFDPASKILMSGDVGASLEPGVSGLFVEDFASHCQYMEGFHQRWMPSNRAKQDWIHRVRELDVQMMCPQHGRVFVGEQVGQFLDWFERLNVGTGVR